MKNRNVLRILIGLVWGVWGASVLLIGYRALDLARLDDYLLYYQILGISAALLLAFVLLPGSFQRFGLFPQASAFVIFYRRFLGLTTYTLAMLHFVLVMHHSPLFNAFLRESGVYELLPILGTTTMIILFPVFITSTDWAQRLLKRMWKKIQRLTYLAFPVVAVHVLLAGNRWLFVVYILVGIFVTASWVYKFTKKHQNPQAV